MYSGADTVGAPRCGSGVAPSQCSRIERDMGARRSRSDGPAFARRRRMMSSHRLPAVSALLVAVSTFGCTNNNTSSNAALTGPSPTVVTETFNGTISQGGTVIHNFSIANSGYNLLAGFTSISPSTVASLGLGIGTWDPTAQTCGLNLTQNDTAKNGSTAISGTAGSGTFCMRVYDGGNLTDPSVAVTYTLQVQHY